jgi:hypothetical protein
VIQSLRDVVRSLNHCIGPDKDFDRRATYGANSLFSCYAPDIMKMVIVSLPCYLSKARSCRLTELSRAYGESRLPAEIPNRNAGRQPEKSCLR